MSLFLRIYLAGSLASEGWDLEKFFLNLLLFFPYTKIKIKKIEASGEY
jgi:hypothetical protein